MSDNLPTERLARLFTGLVAFGFSLALMVRAELGVGPWDVLHLGIARRTGLPLGLVLLLVGLLVLLAWIPLRVRPGFGTVCNVVVVAAVADAGLRLLPASGPLPARVGLLAVGIGLNAIATALYLGARMGPGPRDGLMTGLAAHGLSIRVARTTVELSVLGTGLLLGGPVGVGTVAYAVCIGPLAQYLSPRLAASVASPPSTEERTPCASRSE